MKVGDKIICRERYYENLSRNEIYTITKLCSNGHLMIKNDNCRYGYYHKYYFITLKEQRLLKLEKINESR